MPTLTVPNLFIRDLSPSGPHRCFFCGSACGEDYSTREFVKDTFTGRSDVAKPGSEFVCAGCVACMSESFPVDLPGGETRANQKIRNYSWMITATSRVACNKSHLTLIRATCLSPPTPPFALVLSDSGQKHLLYRGFVCQSQSHVVATLEAERIDYTPRDLFARIALCETLIAATGKPALESAPGAVFGMRVLERYARRGEELLNEWAMVREQPLSRLAQWLARKKEECLVDCPGDV